MKKRVGVSPFSAEAKQREAERRAKAKATAEGGGRIDPPASAAEPEPVFEIEKADVLNALASSASSVAIAPSSGQSLVTPDVAVEAVQTVAPELFVAMVEKRQGLLDALRQVGINSATFFTALDASQALRGWYRGVKAAQAVMDVEQVHDVLADMTADAADDLIGNAERNAKMTVARTKLEQARWAAQKLLPALYGEKTQHESHSKVEIIVRRETKKAVKAASEE